VVVDFVGILGIGGGMVEIGWLGRDVLSAAERAIGLPEVSIAN
jgi:hypothetical protein